MANQTISTKKLRAIVFTDIVNFTQLSAKDEQRALDVIQKQNEIIRPIVEKYNGEWLKEIGDGLLLSFHSSLDAVNCSIKIQQSLKDINDFKIRIGIHQGDIFIKDGDIFGDDVNIASRVESFAPEGGIAISDKISKDISGVKDIKTSFIGYRKLKGVEQETQIKSIVSHSLPHNKISMFPKLAYYMSFVCGIFMILPVIPGLIMMTLENSWNKIIPNPMTKAESVIDMLSNGVIFLLLGFTCLSYVKGISYKAQKFFVYFSYFFILYFIIVIFCIPLYEFYSEGNNNIFFAIIAFIFSMLVVTVSLLVKNK